MASFSTDKPKPLVLPLMEFLGKLYKSSEIPPEFGADQSPPTALLKIIPSLFSASTGGQCPAAAWQLSGWTRSEACDTDITKEVFV